MQFGAFVPQGWRMDLEGISAGRQWDAMVRVAHAAEEAGYDSVWVYDHLHTVPRPAQEPTWEAWTTMTGLAEATQRVRLGQMCTCNSYRHPSYLTKVASCVDVISGGRLEFAIGAGWYRHEYEGYGYEFPSASVRIGMLDEAVQIIKAMWTEDVTSFQGRFYELRGAINHPRPLQQPHPPLWIAGGGEQLTLRVVAKYADGSNFGGGSLPAFLHKSAVLERHCESVGRDFSEIRRSANLDCLIGVDEKDLSSKLERYTPTRGTIEDFKRGALVGTPDRVIEQLSRWGDVGSAYVMIYFVDAMWGDGMEVFAEEVMPSLR
ncbi:MAG: LLM class F420-dependent oxidoreductase [Acidimicrobiia bacterium]